MLVVYFILWVIFNGAVTPEICAFGVVISAAMFAFTCRFMGFSVKKELLFYKKLPLFVRYVAVLVKEIVKANFGVIHMILTQREEVQPVLAAFRSDLKSAVGKAFLANAITLTPGTITVSLEKDKYTVHCLDESLAEGMNDSVFLDYIRKLEE